MDALPCIPPEWDVRPEQRRQILDIMTHLDCPKGFACVTSGSGMLCRARDVGLVDYVQCLDPEHASCEFSLSYGDRQYCRCPLRVYLVRQLGI